MSTARVRTPHISQPGGAAAKRSRRNNCADCRNTAVSRRAERGDLVAHEGENRAGSVAEQFEGKSLQPHADLRFPSRLCNIILQSPHCGDRTTRCQRSRYSETEQTRSLKIFSNTIGLSV